MFVAMISCELETSAPVHGLIVDGGGDFQDRAPYPKFKTLAVRKHVIRDS